MSQQDGGVDVTELEVGQLQDVRKQLEAELQHLTGSYGQLKAAQSRFRTCIESLDTIAASAKEGKEKALLVPLTSSLYVPGTLSGGDKVLVDVGTGYYVERSTDDARTMYQGRVEYVAKSLEQLQETITRKEDNMRVVRDILMVKVQQQQQQGQQQSQVKA